MVSWFQRLTGQTAFKHNWRRMLPFTLPQWGILLRILTARLRLFRLRLRLCMILIFSPSKMKVVHFDHSFDGLEHDCNLLAHISAVEWGPQPFLPPNFSPLSTLPPDIVDQIKAFMLQQLRLFAPGGTVPVGLSALPKQMRFINAGMSVDAQMQFIAIRVQVGGGSDINYDTSVDGLHG